MSFKAVARKIALFLAVAVVGLVGLAFNVFNIVAIARCGLECDATVLQPTFASLHGRSGGPDLFTPIFAQTIANLIVVVLNLLGSTPFGRGVFRFVSCLASLCVFALFLWFLVAHYQFWDGIKEALSVEGREAFICALTPYARGPLEECMSWIAENPESVASRGYLMYYADVITECLFYLSCAILAVGVIISLSTCVCARIRRTKGC